MASKLTRAGYERLDIIIAEQGEDWLHNQIVTRVCDGVDPKEIARSLGVHYICVKRWMEDNCGDDIALALRARADCLEFDATQAVDDADPDSVAVARLKADHYMKLAGKLDRAKFGDKPIAETGGNGLALPQFIISFVNSTPVNHHEKIIIEHETERLIIESE